VGPLRKESRAQLEAGAGEQGGARPGAGAGSGRGAGVGPLRGEKRAGPGAGAGNWEGLQPLFSTAVVFFLSPSTTVQRVTGLGGAYHGAGPVSREKQ
jgi:hypothetical protein